MPLWAVPFLTLILPLLVFVGAYLVSKSTVPLPVPAVRQVCGQTQARSASRTHTMVKRGAAAAPSLLPPQSPPSCPSASSLPLQQPGRLGIAGGGAPRLPQPAGVCVHDRTDRQHTQVAGEGAK